MTFLPPNQQSQSTEGTGGYKPLKSITHGQCDARPTVTFPVAGLTSALLHHPPNGGGNRTTRGYANSRIVNSRTGHLTDWSTPWTIDNSRISQLADWTSRGLDNSWSRRYHQTGKLSTQSRRWHPRVVQSATCPLRELSSNHGGMMEKAAVNGKPIQCM